MGRERGGDEEPVESKRNRKRHLEVVLTEEVGTVAKFR
jgi:hypothetical protein